MSFPRYKRYKESGVEWLGEVPEHWDVKPFKLEIERNDGGVWGEEPDGANDTIVLRSTEQTVDGRWLIEDPAPRKLSAFEKTSALLLVGDLLVTKSSGSSLHIGKTTLVTDEVAALKCCYSNFMQRIRVKSTVNPKFAWYVMNNDLARLQFDYLSNSTTGLANLNSTMIGQIILSVPVRKEQDSIATFLDLETEKVDALISEQQRLIALLAEKRQATISHAVTKGLNPDALMKDSGVEWLGEVPEHWTATRLRLMFKQEKRQGHLGKQVLSVYRDYGVILKDSRDDNMNKTPDDLSLYQLVNPGDLVVNKMKAWQGSLGISALEGITSPDYVVFTPRHKESSVYLHLLLRSQRMVSIYRSISNGIRPAQWRLEPDSFLDLRVFLPPRQEQQKLVSFTIDQILRFDTLTAEAQRAIALLQERRTALISAAVTGKIDVR